jgi:hypothetical protein
MQSSSTRRIFSIVLSMIAYFNASYSREMWSVIDDFLKWDRWWILRQSSFDLKTSLNENEIKNSRTLFTCAILLLSTWLFTLFVIMSEASLTKMRFSFKISWEESMYSIFTSHWIMSRMTRVYVKSEWSRNISNQSSLFNKSRSRRDISSINVLKKNSKIYLNELRIASHDFFLEIAFAFLSRLDNSFRFHDFSRLNDCSRSIEHCKTRWFSISQIRHACRYLQLREHSNSTLYRLHVCRRRRLVASKDFDACDCFSFFIRMRFLIVLFDVSQRMRFDTFCAILNAWIIKCQFFIDFEM